MKYFEILKSYNKKETTLVVHNAKFDLDMLSKSGLNWVGNIIDTMRVSKHLMKDECESFALQFLRYELKLYRYEELELNRFEIDGGIIAHNSLGDVIVTKLLYEYLLSLSTQENMIELSLKNVLLDKFEFGKYSGRYIEDIAINDSSYLIWMLENLSQIDDDLKYSIMYYLGENV